MRRKLLMPLLAGLMMLGMGRAQADRLDAYREMLMKGSYTIRYDNITPPPRVTNRDKLPLFGASGMAVDKNDYLTNRQRSGIIVSDGDDRYEEVGDGKFNMCRLQKGDENFVFTKYQKKGEWRYFGEGEGTVTAGSRNFLGETVDGKSYGEEDTSRLFMAILPDSMKSASLPRYRHARSGVLGGGRSYEDYQVNGENSIDVIRYYFDGDVLTKIAAASYREKPNGKVEGRKSIVLITEFSPVPDRKLLELPETLKDKTKRKKRGEESS